MPRKVLYFPVHLTIGAMYTDRCIKPWSRYFWRVGGVGVGLARYFKKGRYFRDLLEATIF